jgi:hypothetical protein
VAVFNPSIRRERVQKDQVEIANGTQSPVFGVFWKLPEADFFLSDPVELMGFFASEHRKSSSFEHSDCFKF